MKNGQSRKTERQTTQNQLETPFSNWFCVVCRSVSLDCPFFITSSLTGFVLFVVLSLWITKPVREGEIKNGQSRETERQTTQNQLEKE
jgi:membrane protein implicated in regulation of membrane protease activity